jgi:hypothetical protein
VGYAGKGVCGVCGVPQKTPLGPSDLQRFRLQAGSNRLPMIHGGALLQSFQRSVCCSVGGGRACLYRHGALISRRRVF